MQIVYSEGNMNRNETRKKKRWTYKRRKRRVDMKGY